MSLSARRRSFWILLLPALSIGFVLFTGKAGAYEQYSLNKDLTNCAACHGDFRNAPYNEGIVRDPACPPTCDPNTEWPNGLMSTHSDLMVNGQCNACHSSGGRFPTFIGSSGGVFGNLTGGCSGCHGRAADGNGTGTQGFGAGLRQRHYRSGATVCAGCHNDSNPSAFTPVGENVLPPNYQTPGVAAPDVPDDPCNAGTSLEDKVGSLRGLDNDGDGFWDGADTDCGAVASTPGEVNDLSIDAHDPATRLLTLSFTPGCTATGHKIVYGSLLNVATYGYSGETCAVGSAGPVGWTYPALPEAMFFVLVGDNGADEGSYGIDSIGAERPRQTGGACPLPQNLALRCDP